MYERWDLHPVQRELPLPVPRLRRTTLWNKSVTLMTFLIFLRLKVWLLLVLAATACVCDFFCGFSRKQQAFIQRRPPEACWSQEEEQAEEESPGAAASLQTAPQETRRLINTHTLYTETSHLLYGHLRTKDVCGYTMEQKGKLMLLFLYLNLHSNFNKCLQTVFLLQSSCLNMFILSIQRCKLLYYIIVYICVMILLLYILFYNLHNLLSFFQTSQKTIIMPKQRFTPSSLSLCCKISFFNCFKFFFYLKKDDSLLSLKTKIVL